MPSSTRRISDGCKALRRPGGCLRIQNLRQLFFHRRVKLDDGELAVIPQQGLNKGAPKCLPGGFN